MEDGSGAEGREEVALEEGDAIRDTVEADVFPSGLEGVGREVRGNDPASRQGVGQGHSDRARSGADVKNSGSGVAFEAIDEGFHQDLGFGPGDEDMGGDFEGEGKEFGLAQDLLEGDPFQALSNRGLEALLLGWRKNLVDMEGKFGPGDAAQVGQQPLGFGPGIWNASVPKGIDGPGEGVGEGGHGSLIGGDGFDVVFLGFHFLGLIGQTQGVNEFV